MELFSCFARHTFCLDTNGTVARTVFLELNTLFIQSFAFTRSSTQQDNACVRHHGIHYQAALVLTPCNTQAAKQDHRQPTFKTSRHHSQGTTAQTRTPKENSLSRKRSPLARKTTTTTTSNLVYSSEPPRRSPPFSGARLQVEGFTTAGGESVDPDGGRLRSLGAAVLAAAGESAGPKLLDARVEGGVCC